MTPGVEGIKYNLKREAEFKVIIPEQHFKAVHIFGAFYNCAG